MCARLVIFFGRFCLSLVFLAGAVSKIFDWEGSKAYFVQQTGEMISLMSPTSSLQDLLNLALASPGLLLAVAVCFELIGALSVLLGFGVRFGALLLLLFLIPTTVIGHHFWLLQEPARGMQLVMFLKNLSVFGGLLILLAVGSYKAPTADVKEPS